MGRKRKAKYQAKVRSTTEAVPDEVLAEGSGPHEDGSVAAHTAGEEIVELEAADADAPPPTAHDLADILAVVEAAETAEAEPVEAAADAKGAKKPKKRGRGRAASDTQVDAAPATAEVADVDAAEPVAAAVEAVAEVAADEPRTGKQRRGRARTKTDVDAAPELAAPDVDLAPDADQAVDADADNDERDADAEDADGVDANADGGDMAESGPTLRLLDAELDGGEIVEVAADGTAEVIADDQLVELSDEEALAAGAELPTSAASMDAEQIKHLVEALVFASDKPMTLLRLRQLTRISDTKRLEDTLAQIATDYSTRGIVLQCVSGGYQFRTRTQFSAWVQQLIAGRPVRLSRAQLETLAIIAYRQPITRPEIDDIRGVDSSGTLKVLMDRQLIRILGKKEDVGRPMLYGTTKEFLDFFSLGDLRELPTLREYSELTDESRQVINDRLGPLASDTDAATGEGASAADPAMLDADGNPIADPDLSAVAGDAELAPDGEAAALAPDATAELAPDGEAFAGSTDAATSDAVEAAVAHHDEPPGMAYDDSVVALMDDLAEGSDATVMAGDADLAEGSDATVMAAQSPDEQLADLLASEDDEPMTAAGTGAMQAVDPSLIDELVGDADAAAVVDALSKGDDDEPVADPSTFTDE